MDDKVFGFIIKILVLVILVVTLYPLIYVFSMAISDPYRAAAGDVVLFPKGIDFTAIKTVLNDSQLYRYYYNTIWYTVVGTVLGVVVTMLAAYPLSRNTFSAKGIVTIFFVLTMFLNAGLIPRYIVNVKFLHLYNTRWVLILPALTGAWYILVSRNFIKSLPEELFDCAKIDGATEFRLFRNVVMPLSKPILAVLCVHFGVNYWNSYFAATLYLSDKKLQPLALYVRTVVIQNSVSAMGSDMGMDIDVSAADILSKLQIQYAVILIAVVPLLLMYPIFGKYLKKGLMVGSLKG